MMAIHKTHWGVNSPRLLIKDVLNRKESSMSSKVVLMAILMITLRSRNHWHIICITWQVFVYCLIESYAQIL